MVKLDAKHILTLHVELTEDVIVGDTIDGYLKVIPITGGKVFGEITGDVIPGGADWNTSLSGNRCSVFAKYMFKADDGEIITIENAGVFDRNDEPIMKTSPTFRVREESKYSWLNVGLYVGSINRLEDASVRTVEIKIYKLA